MNYQVFKFGGASVHNARGFQNVARICLDRMEHPTVLVLSALGKTTNAMEGVVDALQEEGVEAASRHIDQIEEGHKVIVRQLGLEPALVEKIFSDLRQDLEKFRSLDFDKAYDAIVCFGELCSTTILDQLIKTSRGDVQWLDAREVIATNGIHRDATVDWERTRSNIEEKIRPILDNDGHVIIQGYIGGHNGETTTLGREGSDYTAAIVAFCLDTSEVTIWKDVPGVLSGDPRDFENVALIERLSYREAIEMTYYGAKVIHPKTIKPLQNKGITLFVRSFEDPDAPGTLITQDVEVSYPPIVVIEKNQALLHISTLDFSFVAEHHMSLIFDKVSRHRIKVNMMRNTAISFTVCVTDSERVDLLIEDLSREFNVVIDRNMELVTIRHYNNGDINDIIGTRPVIFEEKIKDTLQMVVREGEGIKRKNI